jgi:hypothetical protein
MRVSEDNCKKVVNALEKEFLLRRKDFVFSSKKMGKICGISPTIIGHVAAYEAKRGGCCRILNPGTRSFVFKTAFLEVVK